MDLGAEQWIALLHGLTEWTWPLFLVVWLAAAFSSKRTVQRQTGASRLGQSVAVWVGMMLLFARRWPMGSLDRRLFGASVKTAAVGYALAVCGVTLCFWARAILGRNWSGTVTLKEGHELVRRGPYRMVRHPIYTGLLLMMVGTAMDYRQARSWVAILVVGVGFWWKIQDEERFMVQEFGLQYELYRREVKALVPFVF